MQRAIGIRVTPDAVYYAIIEEHLEYANVVECSQVKLPKAMDFPQQLRHIRTTFADIINNKYITRAGLKLIETVSKNVSHKRINIEGVFQELIASSRIEQYFTGEIATIASKLGIERADYKKYVKGMNFEQVEGWASYKEEYKESILAGIAALS